MGTTINDALVMVARNIDVAIHRHTAVQVVMSLGAPYDALLDADPQPKITGFVIDSNVPHACAPGPDPVLVMSIDALSARGQWLKRHLLRGRRYVLLSELTLDPEIRAAAESLRRSYVPGHGLGYASLIDALCPVPSEAGLPDQRMRSCVDAIESDLSKVPPVALLAKRIGVSERRLRQLFHAHAGIPVRRFVLWTRIRAALKAIVQGASLASAAQSGGFSDQAHFTRTFREMFGVPPAVLAANVAFLEVFLSETKPRTAVA
jgi:AraC-like DNA-binding protein